MATPKNKLKSNDRQSTPISSNNAGFNSLYVFLDYQGSSFDMVVDFIHKEMMNNINSREADTLKQLLNSKNPINFIRACKLWNSLVNHKTKWDYKEKIENTISDTRWLYDKELHKYYNFDIWSNIHYGYIGKYVGFSEWILLSGAGLAQFFAGTTPKKLWKRYSKLPGKLMFFAALDDSNDQNAIALGFKLWEDFGKNLLKKDLIKEIHSSYQNLYIKKSKI